MYAAIKAKLTSSESTLPLSNWLPRVGPIVSTEVPFGFSGPARAPILSTTAWVCSGSRSGSRNTRERP